MKKVSPKIKRQIRNRKKLRDVNTNKLRITVFKSTKNISAQIIDDKISKTLVSASSTEKEIRDIFIPEKHLGASLIIINNVEKHVKNNAKKFT